MQLERHLYIEVSRLAVDLPPELLEDTPLVVEHVERSRVPRVHDPVRPPAARFSRRQARHRHNAVLAQAIREPYAAPYIFGVLRPDHGIGVQRVAVAVQACDLDARALKQSEELVSRGVGGKNVVERRDVHWRQEAARVELDAGETELGDHLDRLRQ